MTFLAARRGEGKWEGGEGASGRKRVRPALASSDSERRGEEEKKEP